EGLPAGVAPLDAVAGSLPVARARRPVAARAVVRGLERPEPARARPGVLHGDGARAGRRPHEAPEQHLAAALARDERQPERVVDRLALGARVQVQARLEARVAGE